jgi:serine/threonine-protein kinase
MPTLQSDETQALPTSPSSTPSSLDNARFLPGMVIAGRYRIVGLLGTGGMGEVYRADDLKLGQPVALKFLPGDVAEDHDRLNRLLDEVKIARQVSHPNVCRVYDVGETDGHHYLSMEYVDGENLATLLRRIGRLPGDKALQIARQLCAGLAAAHEQGIVHRDLKPANVMLDGLGRAKLTDFGLAGLAEGIQGAEVRAGTPTYMAPEQLSGKEVTIRSDLYSLGLVLYELFTGKRVFEARSAADLMEMQQSQTPTSPSSVTEGIDPAVDRVLLKCLESDPQHRPSTALAVAAALPGGDPLAAALAAGETPSPEMVAAAGPEGGLRSGVAMLCLAVVLVGTVFGMLMSDSTILGHLPFVKSYEALRENAREIAGTLGHTDPPADSASWFGMNLNEYFRIVKEDGPQALPEALALRGQPMLRFVHRQGPRPIVPLYLSGNVSSDIPPPSPGEIAMELDLQGSLAWLRIEPSRSEPVDEPTDESVTEPDWPGLFELAGLAIEDFETTELTVVPEVFADTRMAWSGVLPDQADRPVRIEAASLRGEPVYFETIISSDDAWSTGDEQDPQVPEKLFIGLIVILLLVAALITGGALFLTVRNLRLRRGDRTGAFRIALLVVALRMIQWGLISDHVGHPVELFSLVVAVCGAITLGVMAWIVYVAFEPYVRRLWPEAIVSWSRLLAGRFRDPLVGRDVLLGCTFASGMGVISGTLLWFTERAGWIGPLPLNQVLVVIRGGRYAFGEVFSVLLSQLSVALGLMMLFLLLRMILRKTWIAATALCLLQAALAGLNFLAFGDPRAAIFGVLVGGTAMAVTIFILVRFGLVALVALTVTSGLANISPGSFDVSSPHFGTGLFIALVGLAIAVYGWKVSLAGRPLIQDTLLER